MRPIKLTLANFVSFETLEYTFQEGVTALSGENITDDGQGSNGSGKSTLQQAIYFAITGNNFRGSSDKKLIRRGQKESFVSLSIECPVRKETLFISRSLFHKGSSRLVIENNGKAVEVATVKDGNNYILSWIGISPEDLKSYFLVCKEYYKSFFKSSNAEKMALISRFVNYSYLDKAKPIIQEEISELDSEKISYQREKDKALGAIEALNNVIQEKSSFDFEKDKEERLSKVNGRILYLKSEIDSCESDMVKAKRELSKANELLASQKEELKEIKEAKGELPSTHEIEELIESIKAELGETKEAQNATLAQKEQLQKKHDELKTKLRAVLVNLSGAITCPKCHHKFLTLRGTTLEEEQKKKEAIGKAEKSLMKEEASLDESLAEYEDVISSFIQVKNEQEEEIDKIRSLSKEINSQIYDYEEAIASTESETKRLNLKIVSLGETAESLKKEVSGLQKREKEIKKEKPIAVDVSSQENEIKTYEETIALLDKNMEEVSAKIFKKNEWIGRFKEFKMYLACEQLKNIQTRANDILKKENSDLRILIEGFKTNANGETKDEITPYVVRDEAENFWYYSGGERARVEIALIIAIQTMINETNEWGGLQFLSIDEITEGLSKESLYDVIEALDFIKFPILITTHISNENAKCKTLKIIKENGVSRIG